MRGGNGCHRVPCWLVAGLSPRRTASAGRLCGISPSCDRDYSAAHLPRGRGSCSQVGRQRSRQHALSLVSCPEPPDGGGQSRGARRAKLSTSWANPAARVTNVHGASLQMLHARVGQGLHAEISLVCARLEEAGHLDECEREGMCGAAVASAPGLLMLNAVTRSCADVPSPACVTQLEGLASDHSTMKSHSMSCFRRRLAITRVGCPLAAAASACCTGGAALSARCLVVEHSAPISYRNASELFERPGTQRKIDRHERLRRAPSKRKSACQESALQVWLAFCF